MEEEEEEPTEATLDAYQNHLDEEDPWKQLEATKLNPNGVHFNWHSPKLPLIKKTQREKQWEHQQNQQPKHKIDYSYRDAHVSRALYEKMYRAVNNHFTVPYKQSLALYMRDMGRYDQQDYWLIYYPYDHETALNVLQKLHTLEIEERSQFVTFLQTHPLPKWCGIDDPGRFLRLDQTDVLPSEHYTQICEIVVPSSK
jgi:hypothetical protein